MNLQRGLCGFIASVLLFMILCTGSAHCEEAKKDRRSIFWLSDRDLFLPITAIEWGAPDRFSFTSRLIHRLDREREGREWFSSVSLMVSPGSQIKHRFRYFQ